MATKELTFNIFGRDRTATKTIRGVGTAANNLGRGLTKLGGVLGAVFTARAIVDFGRSSVEAFLEAEKAQQQLSFAFEQFPALADTNIKQLQKLNSMLALKTGYDDDATASAQAVLAGFKLTGAQLIRLTPLLQDYARRTGKELPDAAEDLGKAILGQGRALKAIGIEFQDTGDETANLEQLLGLLQAKIGGFAQDAATETAAGRFAVLTTRFGEMQEKIGLALLPAIEDLAGFAEERLLPAMEGFSKWLGAEGIPKLREFGDWVSENGPLVLGLGAVTIAAWALNAALNVNPVVLAFSALTGAVMLLGAAWDWVTNHTREAERTMLGFALGVLNFVSTTQIAITNLVLGGLNGIIDMLNAVTRAFHDFASSIGINVGLIQLPKFTALGADAYGTYGVMNNGILGGTKVGVTTPGGGGSGGKAPLKFASGGIVRATPGGIHGIIGEAGRDEAVIPLPPGYDRRLLGREARSENHYHVHLNGIAAMTETQLVQALRTAVQNVTKQGGIPKGGLAG